MLTTRPCSNIAGEEAGTVAITFGLTAMVVMMSIGCAVDFGRALAMHSTMQKAGDAAALNSVNGDAAAAEARLATANSLLPLQTSRYGGTSAQMRARWLSATDYEVIASAEVPTSFLRIMPGDVRSLRASTRSVARSHRMKVVAGPPSKIDLSYEAADYNQVWAYCFDPAWTTKGTRASDEGTKFQDPTGDLAFTKTVATQENRYGRSDFVLIADNGGSTIPFAMPTCKEGETVSYMLYNSRNSRTTPANWKKNHTSCGTALSQTGKSCYTWYTDARPDAAGIERHSGTSPYQLETVLCSDAQCLTPLNGGVIPGNNQRNRIPQVAAACQPGKFMYFGWEDRPPQNQGGNGSGAPYAAGTADPGGDRDYDDIRVIMSCPTVEKEEVLVRLIE